MPDVRENLISLNHAARDLGLSPSTVRAYADQGRIACVRSSNGTRLFTPQAVEQFRTDREERRR